MLTMTLKKQMRAVWCALAVLAVFGSVCDLAVSRALYNDQNPLAVLLAGYGQLPLALLFWFGAAALLHGLREGAGHFGESGKVQNAGAAGDVRGAGPEGSANAHRAARTRGIALICSIAGASVLCALGLYTVVSESKKWIALPLPALCGIAAVLCACTLTLCLRLLLPGAQPGRVKRAAGMAVGECAASFLIVNVLKNLWCRPRMRWLAGEGFDHFCPWWAPGSALKNTCTALGVAAEEFKSFPSGHTAYAALALALPLLAWVCPRLRGREKLLFAIGLGWLAAVALSRIVMGAHFITDVTAGAAVSLAVLCAAEKLGMPKGDKTQG